MSDTIIMCTRLLVMSEDSLCSSELASRDQKIKELNESFSSEHKLRVKTEKQREKLTAKLVRSTSHLTCAECYCKNNHCRGTQKKI